MFSSNSVEFNYRDRVHVPKYKHEYFTCKDYFTHESYELLIQGPKSGHLIGHCSLYYIGGFRYTLFRLGANWKIIPQHKKWFLNLNRFGFGLYDTKVRVD